MTKQEIIDLISESHAILGEAVAEWESIRQPENVQLYRQIAYKLINGAVQENSIYFYVKDEGDSSEAAYLRVGQENKLDQPGVFSERIDSLIASKIQNGDIEGVFDIKNIDNENKTAVILAMVQVGDKLMTKRYFIDEDESGDLQYRQFGG